MGLLIELIATFAPYIYAVCGLTALWQIYRAWHVRELRRQAVFSYEREKAIRELYSIFFTAFALLLVMGVTYFTSTTLKTAIDPIISEARNPVPTIPFQPSPTTTPLDVTPTATDVSTATIDAIQIGALPELVTPQPGQAVTDALAATALTGPTATSLPTAPPPPTETPAPAPAVAPTSCGDPGAQIYAPGNGQSVSGLVSIIGTATHPEFANYKVEYALGSSASGNWSYLGGGQTPVQNDVLYSFDARTLSPGAWTLRLVVVRIDGNYSECPITIQIQ